MGHKRSKLREMNRQAHRMAQDLLYSLEDLIAQTETNAMLSRKLSDDDRYNEDIDHTEVLRKLELSNKYLKLVKILLSDIDDAAKQETIRE